jgi:uncharacterized membrane protein
MKRLTAVLALAGVAVAVYLTWVHYAGLQPLCLGGSGGCVRVQSSVYAQLAGVPVALLGLAGYVAILAALALPDQAGRSAAAFLSIAGAAFSAYLTYIELVEIEAICQWCVVSAVLMTALAAVSIARSLAPARQPTARPGR